MQGLHGVDSVGVLEFDDGDFAESAPADDLERFEVVFAKAKLFDLDEDRLGVVEKVGNRLFSPENPIGGRKTDDDARNHEWTRPRNAERTRTRNQERTRNEGLGQETRNGQETKNGQDTRD